MNPYRTAGLVTAAGASSRMGSPKALLKLPDGSPLAAHQLRRLVKAGCNPVTLVLGSEAERIQSALPTDLPTVLNQQWVTGRFSSIQTGLRALWPFDACVILPVDAVGLSDRSIDQLIEYANQSESSAVRPTYQGKPGHLLWIDQSIGQRLLAYEGAMDQSLQDWLRDETDLCEINDPRLTANVNTPEQWRQWLETLAN